MLQVLAGLQPPQYRSADVNLDSQVTIADAVRLRAEIAGFLDPLPMPAQ